MMLHYMLATGLLSLSLPRNREGKTSSPNTRYLKLDVKIMSMHKMLSSYNLLTEGSQI